MLIQNAAAHGSAVVRQRQALIASLQARQADIVQTALTRSYGLLSDGQGMADPEYVEGLRAAVVAAIDYGVASIENGDANKRNTPAPLLDQARLAVAFKIPLDTVLRRYFAGFTLFTDTVLEEAAENHLASNVLRGLMRELSMLFEGLVADVACNYTEAQAVHGGTSERRLAERIEHLLDGQLLDLRTFGYDFDGFQIGVVAAGGAAEDSVRGLASALDRGLLIVKPRDDIVWGWMGGRREVDTAKLDELVEGPLREGAQMAMGEEARGINGWRLTHRQAKAALPVALRSKTVVRYAGVALLASALQDDLLAASLREIYLRPLAEERDGGATARRTLLAYFAAERNASSAAAMMGVSRRTVTNRLRSIEQRLGRPLRSVDTELETTLRLDEIVRDEARSPGESSPTADASTIGNERRCDFP
jgi:PucR C-terminal helix-turn-helix domain/GGDEF-like domain